jgi:hypothetical protein
MWQYWREQIDAAKQSEYEFALVIRPETVDALLVEIARLNTEIDRITKLNERQSKNAEEACKSESHWRQQVRDAGGGIAGSSQECQITF